MSESQSSRRFPIYLVLVALVIVVVAWLSNWILGSKYLCETQRGGFGDMFGCVAALFSGLGLTFLVATLWVQHKELQDQHTALSEQGKLLEKQNSALNRQIQEHSFFELLRFWIDSNQVHRDKDHYREWWEKDNSALKGYLGKELRDDKDEKSPELDKIKRAYLGFNNAGSKGWTETVYESLYRLLKSVDQSQLEHKQHYTDIVRAHLSTYELVFLFYFALKHREEPSFKSLIEQYGMLRFLNKNLLAEGYGRDLYDSRAYGEGHVSENADNTEA